MKTQPYPYKNKAYNRSCLVCGKVCNGINMHVTQAEYFEQWLVSAREDAGIPIRREEIPHITLMNKI